MNTYNWQPESLAHYPLIEHTHLSSDGQSILFTVRMAYLSDEASEFRNQIMLARIGSERPIQLTFAEGASQPRWSQDGRFIAFLRKEKAERNPGLWIMRADGGEAWPLTGEANGIRNEVTTFRWSPDGSQIAFLTVPWDSEQERRRKRREDVEQWRVDYDYTHLHVVDVLPAAQGLPQVTQLSHGRLNVSELAWSPDGARIAFVRTASPLADHWLQSRLATLAADGSETAPTDLGLIAARQAFPHYSPNGKWIAAMRGSGDIHWAFSGRVALFATSGGDTRFLADVSDENPEVIGWCPDSRTVYVQNQNGWRSEIVALPVDGSPAQTLFDGDKLLAFAHVNQAGQAAVVAQDFHEPNSIYRIDLNGAIQPATLHRVAAPPLPETWPEAPLPRIRQLSWSTPDGFTIEGVLYLPADYEESSGDRLPLLLHVHGGPMSIFQRQFVGHPYYYTPAAICERGIAMLRCNPRGSGGYGKHFRQANRRDWGGGDYQDLQQGVDTIIEMGIADPERLGICGWSYGGYMTSWTITQTDRFKAASIGAAVTNLMSFNGTADIPSFIPDYFDAEFWDDLTIYMERSPIFQVQNAHTPSIIQHGSADPRVPLEQGLQFYNALERLNVPVKMYIYPRQGHAILEPRLLMDVARRNLDWFEQMLV